LNNLSFKTFSSYYHHVPLEKKNGCCSLRPGWSFNFQIQKLIPPTIIIMKLTIVATLFAALASTGFAESSFGATTPSVRGDAPAAADVTIDGAKNQDDRAAAGKRRGLGKKAIGKDPAGYGCKLCCNDDWDYHPPGN
jgi:hypothetical protein